MAKIVESNVQSQTFNSAYSVWRIVVTGAVLGVLYWGLTLLVGMFIDSIAIAGNIATILTATIGLIAMVSMRMTRPLIVTLASAVALWGLAQLTDGLVWSEVIAWNILLYAISYTLFSWIARYARVAPVLIVIMTIVALVRIAITL